MSTTMTGVSPPPVYEVLRLCGPNDIWIMSILPDGNIAYNRQLPLDEMSKRAIETLTSAFSLLPLTASQSRKQAKQDIIAKITYLSAQWSLLRSLKATYYTRAAKKIIELIDSMD